MFWKLLLAERKSAAKLCNLLANAKNALSIISMDFYSVNGSFNEHSDVHRPENRKNHAFPRARFNYATVSYNLLTSNIAITVFLKVLLN